MTISFSLLWMSLVIGHTSSQIVTEARLQPFPLVLKDLVDCCPFAKENNVSSLFDCVSKTDVVRSTGSLSERSKVSGMFGSDVGLLSFIFADTDTSHHFAVPDIVHYGSYHAATVAAYATHNHYMYHIASPDQDGNAEPSDVRWNKVQLLIDALDPKTGWARHLDYVVWIDADAIILDFGLRIENIGQQYPRAHILASADIRQGYINSGFLIVKNTEWSLQFLKEWWSITDRSTVCDQDAFDMVYRKYADKERRELGRLSADDLEDKLADPSFIELKNSVTILRRDALNTDPPASLNLKPHNQILHLMGESSEMRHRAFRTAFKTICWAEEGVRVLPSQVGLHRHHLRDIAVQIYHESTQKQMRMLENKTLHMTDWLADYPREGHTTLDSVEDLELPRSKSAVIEKLKSEMVDVLSQIPLDFEDLGKAAHHLCDLLAANKNPDIGREIWDQSQKDLIEVRRKVFDLALQWVEKTSKYLNSLNYIPQIAILQSISTEEEKYVKGMKSHAVGQYLQLLKRGAEAGNDVFGAVLEEKEKMVVAEKVFSILQELLHLVHDDSRTVPLHMIALMHQNIAYLQYEIAMKQDPKDPNQIKDTESTDTMILTERGNKFRKITARREHHLKVCEHHAKQSVDVMDQTYTYGMGDRSINEEHVHSLQILAASYCIDKRNLGEGIKIWERAVAKARDNTHNINMGRPLEILSGIYHNAAACHLEAELFDKATSFVKKAIEGRQKLAREKILNFGKEGILRDEEEDQMLQLSRTLHKKIETQYQAFLARPPSSRNDDGMKESKTQPIPQKMSDFDEEEWEECDEGDEDCEAFFVIDDKGDILAEKEVNLASIPVNNRGADAQQKDSRQYTDPTATIPPPAKFDPTNPEAFFAGETTITTSSTEQELRELGISAVTDVGEDELVDCLPGNEGCELYFELPLGDAEIRAQERQQWDKQIRAEARRRYEAQTKVYSTG